MKRIGWVLSFGWVLLSFFATSAYAQSPREQLQQMVEQLQKTPDDNALRERIIKLGAEIKPAPAIPDEAVQLEGRAQAAFSNARSKADFALAVQEYEKAVAIAPWIVGYYLDLCTIYEKAGVSLEAQRNCQLALLGEQETNERVALKRRIAGLGLLAERFSESSLRGNYHYPFQPGIDATKWPSGVRYFCEAWSREDEKNTPRREAWLVYDGSVLTGVHINWISAETLAETFRRYGGDQYEVTSEVFRRDPSRERTYDEQNNPGIQQGREYVINGDGSAIEYSNKYRGLSLSCKRQDG